jgi:hypothetical protein
VRNGVSSYLITEESDELSDTSEELTQALLSDLSGFFFRFF